MSANPSTPIYDACGEIIGAATKVHRAVDGGFLESVSIKAPARELSKLGKQVEKQVPIHVRYKDAIEGEFFAELLGDRKIIAELKAMEKLAVAHEVQLNVGSQILEYKKKFRRPLSLAKNDSVNSV